MQNFYALGMLELPFVAWAAICVVTAYFFGSIPFGYIAGKMKGLDIREHGSGNIGATNAIRVLGKGIGLPVFLLDFLKGFTPVILVKVLFGNVIGTDLSVNEESTLLVITGLSAVLGHTFTCWLQFKGGKGVATAGGVLFGLFLVPALLVLGTWIIVLLVSKYVSLASVCCTIALPISVAWQEGYFSGDIKDGSLPLLIFSLVICVLVILKHRSNISRLLAGTEHKAFSKKN